jgi:hypothetical protein
MYQLGLVSGQKKHLLKPDGVTLEKMKLDSKQLKVSHALAKKLLDLKVYFKHIQYFLTQLIVNFSSHVSLARILTNLDAQKDKYLTP